MGIMRLQNGKQPGPDGFTVEFYKTLRDEIVTTLNKLYNGMWEGNPYFNTGKEAHIRVLPKKDKDPPLPASYRPISLINVDAKPISKILDQLVPIMPSLINSSQAGFLKGRSGVANIRKVLLALEYAKRNPRQDNIIITLDFRPSTT